MGGWLLLEPGPSYQVWEEAAELLGGARPPPPQDAEQEVGDGDRVEDVEGEEAPPAADPSVFDIEDERGLLTRLGPLAPSLVERYRSEWLSDRDFEWLRDRGFNAVRIPFGYWVVSGPTAGDPYVGPGLDHLDRAVDLAERFGFQVVLDLHGNPGSENGQPPSGYKHAGWKEGDWRRKEALDVIEQLARRYAARPCVTGLQVCNEPSPGCDMERLCDWYQEAILRIRSAGMAAGSVAVVLAVYWYDRLGEFLEVWMPRGNCLRFENVALDLHFYQCFGRGWESLDHHQHLQVVRRHGQVLRSLPGAVVGEWSLARPAQVLATDEMNREFAEAQLEAYRSASHGWFFWTYCDQALEWDLETCFDSGWMPGREAFALDRVARAAPPGEPPRCYGEEEFSGLTHSEAPALEPGKLAAYAEALAQTSGRPMDEAAVALRDCDGNTDAALAQLLAMSTAARLAEFTACSVGEAVKALRECGNNETAAAERLLDIGARGVKRTRDSDS